MTGLLDRVVEGSDDLLSFPRVTTLDHPLVDVLAQGLSSDGQLVAGHETLLDQKGHDAWVGREVPSAFDPRRPRPSS